MPDDPDGNGRDVRVEDLARMSPAGIHSLPAWRVSYGWVVLGVASVPSVVGALARTQPLRAAVR